MSFNGSGTFLINSTGQPVVANTVISATVFNALTADLASGLTNCITKDGQSTPTANIPMGSNKITGLANGTLINDAATLGQVQSTVAKLISSISGVDTVLGIMSPTLTAYAAGQLFYFVAAGANTGAVTLNIDGLGAKAVTRDGATALAAGDINSGEIVVVIYDGTRFQMINAANSFGNTTINGTLTVTGNTGLQANVSITSALSVGGTFNVTGAATLGSTLSVTGKSDLPTVSTASINAAVAVVTTGTVTNLTSTSASIASVNAGVALLTTATVTDLTATGASIASANIGNLQFTAASIASINAGVAVVTNLTATSASIASANVGTAVITTGTVTNLTSTSASIASANAAVALVTTGTVTNLTSTAASIASANLGTAVVTTGTVTNLTATSASIVSANAGAAVVTNLTATGASIASANVGTAVVTGLTVTGASIASVNVGAAVLSGNLTLNGGTANGVLYLNGSKVATSGSAVTYDGTTFATTGAANFATSSGNVGIGGTADAASRMEIVGTAPSSGGITRGVRVNHTIPSSTTTTAAAFTASNTTAAASFTLTNAYGFSANGVGIGAGSSITNMIGFIANDNILTGTNNYGFYSNIASGSNRFNFYANGTADNYFAGNVGIGTASPSSKLQISNGTAVDTQVQITNSVSTLKLSSFSDGSGAVETTGAYALRFFTDATERMRVSSNGNVGIGGTAAADTKLQILGTYPVSGTVTRIVRANGTIPSSATGEANIFQSSPAIENAVFTLPALFHYKVAVSSFGSATVTNQYGFHVDSSLTGATNNYGFYSNIASGSNRWNFYAAGTAQNYFAGDTGVGTTPLANVRLGVLSAGTTSGTYAILARNSSSTDLFSVRSDGLFQTGTNTQSPANNTTATAANVVVDTGTGALQRSTSSLRYKTNVADATHGLADVLKLRSVTYKGKNDGDKVFGGLIAEEVHDAGLTEFVAYDKEGRPDALHYGNMVALLVKAVQELSAKVTALEAR